MKKPLVYLRDLAGLLAIASISYGAWLIYEPAGYVAAGTIVLAAVLAMSRGDT